MLRSTGAPLASICTLKTLSLRKSRSSGGTYRPAIVADPTTSTLRAKGASDTANTCDRALAGGSTMRGPRLQDFVSLLTG